MEQAELDFIESLISGAFTLKNLTSDDVTRCHELITTYRNLDLGLADASVVATAERLNIHRILTLDERDFRAVRSKKGRPFVLLPADGKPTRTGSLNDTRPDHHPRSAYRGHLTNHLKLDQGASHF